MAFNREDPSMRIAAVVLCVGVICYSHASAQSPAEVARRINNEAVRRSVAKSDLDRQIQEHRTIVRSRTLVADEEPGLTEAQMKARADANAQAIAGAKARRYAKTHRSTAAARKYAAAKAKKDAAKAATVVSPSDPEAVKEKTPAGVATGKK